MKFSIPFLLGLVSLAVAEKSILFFSEDAPRDYIPLILPMDSEWTHFRIGKVAGAIVDIPLNQLNYFIENDPHIDFAEEDGRVEAFGTNLFSLQFQYAQTNKVIQTGAPWGIVRTTSRQLPAGYDYVYDDKDGKDVDVYIIDTGIYLEHSDLGNRAHFGFSTVHDHSGDMVKTDDNGHGTHVAGIIASKTYGMCKACHLFAVKVLDKNGVGSYSDVIAGIEYVTNQHQIRIASKRSSNSVINMSLGGPYSKALNKAVEASINEGVHIVVAAGNSNDDSCGLSPASSPEVITVGATDSSDTMAFFSSYGPCMDIFAPGLDIESTWINDENATQSLSGTSMSSPHLCGGLAILLSMEKYKNYSPKQMKKVLANMATRGIVTNIPTDLETPNALLYIDRKEDSGFRTEDLLMQW